MIKARAFIFTIPRRQEQATGTQIMLSEFGIKAELFFGLDHEVSGLTTDWTQEFENGFKFRVSGKELHKFVSWGILWMSLRHLPDPLFLVMADNYVPPRGWMEKAESTLELPWDILYLSKGCGLNAALVRPEAVHQLSERMARVDAVEETARAQVRLSVKTLLYDDE